MVERTDNEIISQLGYGVPGGDVVKTIIFIIFSLILLFVLCGPFSPPETPAAYYKLTQACMLIGVLLCACSAGYAQFVQTSRACDLKKGYKIFYPKIILEAGMLIIFLIICFWTIILGGIFSPFGSLLVVSPIFFLVDFFRFKDISNDVKLIRIIDRGGEEVPRDTVLGNIERFLIKTINRLNIAILILVLFTVTIGEYFVKKYYINLVLYPSDIIKITSSYWNLVISYIIYYLSVVATFIALLPRSYTINQTRKLLL